MAEEEASAANLVEEVEGGAETDGGGGADASAFAQDDSEDAGEDAGEEDVESVEFD